VRVTTVIKPALLLAAALLLLSACSPQQTQALGLVNDARSTAGVHELLPSPHAMAKAQAWAEHLAATGRLAHSELRAEMPDGFLLLAENVGRGPSMEAIHQAFMGSAAHRSNLLDRRFQWAGTGHAVATDGTVYVVQVFARY
jgi:uncharacterized protein YkwD